MNCPGVRRNISRLEGGDLPLRKRRGLEDHLQACPRCREYRNEYRAALAALKNPEVPEGADFTEAEWNAAVRAAISQPPGGKIPRRVRSFRPAIAYALAFILAVVSAYIGMRRFTWLIPTIETHSRETDGFASRPNPLSSDITAAMPGSAGWAARPDIAVPPSVLTDKIPSRPPAAEDVPSFTWISQETGLKIVWFINENLELED